MSARIRMTILLLAAATCAGGCGVRGSWTLQEVQPAVGNEDYTIARASFYPNGSFEAVSVRNGETVKTKGTYEYCPCREELVLTSGDEIRVYKASRKSCNRLHIQETTDYGESVTVVMRRVERCDRNRACRGYSCCLCD
jgi:hypothetical protein